MGSKHLHQVPGTAWLLLCLPAILLLSRCSAQNNKSDVKTVSPEQAEKISSKEDSANAYGRYVNLPAPYKVTKKIDNEGKAIGWKDGHQPKAPEGFKVETYADDLEHPRWIYVADNGDVFVTESDDKSKSKNRITLFRDTNGDGLPDLQTTFLEELNQPFGMLIHEGYFYVANVDGVVRFPYAADQTQIDEEGEKILELPAGGYNHHWTRNIISNEDGSKFYISVGSSSNNGEHGMDKERRRANILEINPDGSEERIYASGLRNPVGIAFHPETNVLYAAVNERDELGDNLVPDYLTSVKEGGFYGWPFYYWGTNVDPTWKGEIPDTLGVPIVPDVALGGHTSSLGLAFYDQDVFPEKYHNGAFVAQHGSWNRTHLNGYMVLFIPFDNGEPSGDPEPFLTGFIADLNKYEVYGRPTGVFVASDGSLLVTDDDANTIWRVSVQP